MTTWHPYPDVPLPKTEFWQPYLVTAVPVLGDNKKPYVRMAYGRCDFWGYEREFTVIAWAELPAPYRKAEAVKSGEAQMCASKLEGGEAGYKKSRSLAAPLACPCRHFRVDRRKPHVA